MVALKFMSPMFGETSRRSESRQPSGVHTAQVSHTGYALWVGLGEVPHEQTI